MKREVTVYLRIGCSLCDAMLAELRPLAERLSLRVSTVDVDGDPELVRRHGERVPVLIGPGETELCHYFLDPTAVERLFAAP